MGKYKPVIILTLALTVFLASCKGATTIKSWVVTTLAGDGTATQFGWPSGVAVDSSGNVYVADTENNRIRKITPTGKVTTLAGSGDTAQFSGPYGVAVDSSGNLYVADEFNNRIRKITPTGVVSPLAGDNDGWTGYRDAVGEEARFRYPTGVAVDSSGIVYVADAQNNCIRKIDTTTRDVTTLADSGGIAVGFWNPKGVAVDSSGNVYVADMWNNRIRKITSAGVVTTLAGSDARTAGHKNGAGTAARFNSPRGVAVDSSGNVYVADAYNNRIRKIEYK